MPEPAGYMCEGGLYEAAQIDSDGTPFHNEPIFTPDQVREVIKAATERAATKATSLANDAAYKYANGYPVDFEKEVGDAIRGMK